MKVLYIRLGLMAPDTEFNRRAAEYAAQSSADHFNAVRREAYRPKPKAED
jgi:hypothetical protein